MQKKRSEAEILDIVLRIAKENDNVNAVILNGSRANPNIKPDEFQDFDILFIVNNIEILVTDTEFPKQFGTILIMQQPDSMAGTWENNKNRYAYLMLFTDGNRIDLTLIPQTYYLHSKKDSLSIVLLDKMNIYSNFPPPTDKDYLIAKPAERDFSNCCNEFWWVATYVAKGLARQQILYAKHAYEVILREEFLKMLAWKVGTKTHFTRNFGTFYKYLPDYLDIELWQQIKKTYVYTDPVQMWQALFTTCDIFNSQALLISQEFNYFYNQKEAQAVRLYMSTVQSSCHKDQL